MVFRAAIRSWNKLLSNLSSGYCWIGLLDWSIRIAIHFVGLDCDWQSNFKKWIWIWIGNPAKPLQSKSKEISSFYFLSRKLQSSSISKPRQFLLIVLKKFGSCLELRYGPWGLNIFEEKSDCNQKYQKIYFSLDWIWIVNPVWKIDLDLDCQS